MRAWKDAIGDHPRLRLAEVGGQLIDSDLIVTNLRSPQILNLLGVLCRLRHSPTVDPQFPVSKQHGGQLQSQVIHLRNELFNIELRHFVSTSNFATKKPRCIFEPQREEINRRSLQKRATPLRLERDGKEKRMSIRARRWMKGRL
jgi:hypothetical protein